jgi:hypothetical protein
MLKFTGCLAALLLLTGCSAEDRGVDAIVKLKGKEFEDAVWYRLVSEEESPQLSTNDTIRLLEKIQTDSSGGSAPSKSFDDLFKLACKKANATHYDALAKIFTTLPTDSWSRRTLWPSLTGLYMERELIGLRASPPAALEFPSGDAPSIPLPKEISPELAAAAQFALTVSASFNAARKKASEKPQISFQNNQALYWKAVDTFLLGLAKHPVDDLLAFQWASFCGTGAEEFAEPNSVMVFLALVHEKRHAEAVGALLRILASEEVQYSYEPATSQRKEFLALCGLDTTRLVIGALAARDIGNADQYVPTADLLRLIGGHAAQKAVPSLIEIARRASTHEKTEYIRTLCSMVATQKKDLSKGDGLALQEDIFHFLDEMAGPQSSFQTVTSVAEGLGLSDHPQSKRILARLLEHPSKQVAKAATDSLSSLGEQVEMPPRPSPVRFAIKVNGLPFATKKLEWRGEGREGGTSGIDAVTGPKGELAIERDVFLDPTRRLNSLILRNTGADPTIEPLFLETIPIPESLDGQHPVDVSTTPLEIRFSLPPQQSPENRQMRVTLKRLAYVEERYRHYRPLFSIEVPMAESLKLAGIQSAEYQIEVEAPEIAAFSAALTPPESGIFEIKLEPGADVRMKLLPPKDWHPTSLLPVLIHEGKELTRNAAFDPEKGTNFQGLPYGDYLLKIPSSKELRERLLGVINDGVEFDGIERAFRIEEKSPPVIDLGDIPLPQRL